MIKSTDFPALTEELQEIFNETSKQKISEMEGKKLFDVGDTTVLNYLHLVMHGLGHPERVAEGQNIPIQNADEGDSITYSQQYYGSGFAVTKKMRKFDMYDAIRSMPGALADGGWDAVDQSLADVLLFGWSTSYTDVYGGAVSAVGPDGLALFNTAHTYGDSNAAGTYSNMIVDSGAVADKALARDPIIATRAIARKYQDGRGLNRGIDLDTLVVSPDNEDLAERLLFSTQLPGSTNNDINALKGKVKQIIVWDRLAADNAGTDKSDYWFLANGKNAKETLKAKFAERPSLDAPEQVYENKNWEYTLDFFYAIGLGFQPYVYGSRGTA